MIRLLSWNIERFGLNKLLGNAWDPLGARQNHILEVIDRADPDVIVVQEVQTTWTNFGGLIAGGSGPAGVLAMHNFLVGREPAEVAAGLPAPEWGLVPPAILTPNGGYSEGIAVLFKGSKLSFEGPMVWTAAGIQAHAVGVVPAPYPGLWEGTMPAAVSQTYPLIPQRQLAGRYEFLAGGVRLQFGGPNARSIWQTRFRAVGGGRFLDLYSVHFPPQIFKARQALGELASVENFLVAPAANEDRVILGDMNINASSANGVLFRQFTHGEAQILGAPLVPIAYTLMFPGGPNHATVVRAVLGAATNGANPLYGYAARNVALQPKALDNALVVRGGVAAAPNEQSVVNLIITAPEDMEETIPEINANINNAAGRKKRFNTLVNFGHIGGRRGASDHLALRFDLP